VAEGGNLPAMMRAQDQALVEGLRAVPKGERRFVREISTEEAYLDWQLRLRTEQMQESREQVERLSSRRDELLGQMLWSEELDGVFEELRQAEETWTEKCLAWMEIFEEIYDCHASSEKVWETFSSGLDASEEDENSEKENPEDIQNIEDTMEKKPIEKNSIDADPAEKDISVSAEDE
jgi:hypothetical protein